MSVELKNLKKAWADTKDGNLFGEPLNVVIETLHKYLNSTTTIPELLKLNNQNKAAVGRLINCHTSTVHKYQFDYDSEFHSIHTHQGNYKLLIDVQRRGRKS
jgi:hypothetical protein